MNKKIISLLTAAALIFAALYSSGCRREVPAEDFTREDDMAEEPVPGGSLAVPYISTDSLNPFYSISVANTSLVSLIYRSLYYMDSSFSPVRDLAENENINGLNVRVKIISDLVFSDGAPVTAQDVVYSFECAKNSPCFKEVLKGIKNCVAEDSFNVSFGLLYPDVNIFNALYFPIVKKGTATTESTLPVGCGCYRFSQDGIRLSLAANMKYAGNIPEIGTVRLVDIKGNESPEHLVDTGELDFCYSDLADANTNRVYSSVTNVYLNSLVYLGVNSESKILGLSDLRQAFSYALDRQSICENAFRGYARASVFPFNTSWKKLSSSAFSSDMALGGDPVMAKKLFEERNIGAEKNQAEISLVCSDTNSFIRNTATAIEAMLKPYNVIVHVNPMTPENLRKTVYEGMYDIYLAEIKLPSTMDLSAFFTYDGAAVWGIDLKISGSDEMYYKYREGQAELDSFLDIFSSEMPFIPLCFRNGRFCYTRDVTSELSALENRIYGGIPGWTFSAG